MADVDKRFKEILDYQLQIIQRLQVIEEKLDAVSVGESKPKGPEPILTCVQCQVEYKDSENGDGSCKYHSEKLTGFHRYTYGCCNANHTNYDAAQKLIGCKKGKHKSEHHTDYSYSAYFKYMSGVTQNAKELWLLVEALDPVSTCYLWAETGLTENGKVYVIVGENRVSPLAVKEIAVDELKQNPVKDGCPVLLERSGESGWNIKCCLVMAAGHPKGIELSVKPSLLTSTTTKRVGLKFDNDTITGEGVEVISDLEKLTETGEYDLPKDEKIGPFLDSGVDYSKDRKTDYKSESSDGCPLEVVQRGKTKVSSTYGDRDGYWINKFAADLQVTNPSDQRVAVTDILGFYMDKEGEWVACDEVLLGFELFHGSYQWDQKPNFNINQRSTGNVTISLGIKVQGNAPSDHAGASRAHYALPQPLHLKAVLKDHQGKSVAIRFEQGNPALNLPNEEKRTKDWAKDGAMLGYCFVDNVDKRERYDAALFYNSQGILNFRYSNQNHYLRGKLNVAVVKAKLEGAGEYYLEDLSKESSHVTEKVWALIDVEKQLAYGMKVELKTATSTAVSYWKVPCEEEPSVNCLVVEPQEVIPGGNLTVKWDLPRVSKSDHIYFYNRNGTSSLSGLYCDNKSAVSSGSATIKAPKSPGVYEARYHPSWLSSSNNGYRRDRYWGLCRFSVKA